MAHTSKAASTPIAPAQECAVRSTGILSLSISSHRVTDFFSSLQSGPATGSCSKTMHLHTRLLKSRLWSFPDLSPFKNLLGWMELSCTSSKHGRMWKSSNWKPLGSEFLLACCMPCDGIYIYIYIYMKGRMQRVVPVNGDHIGR